MYQSKITRGVPVAQEQYSQALIPNYIEYFLEECFGEKPVRATVTLKKVLNGRVLDLFVDWTLKRK